MDATRLVMVAVTAALIGWALVILVKFLTPRRRGRASGRGQARARTHAPGRPDDPGAPRD